MGKALRGYAARRDAVLPRVWGRLGVRKPLPLYNEKRLSGKTESIPQHCMSAVQTASPERAKHANEAPPTAASRHAVRCMQSDRQAFPDHCHAKARTDPKEAFRGYICRQCNSAIGMLGDCEQGVERALKYLKKANERTDDE